MGKATAFYTSGHWGTYMDFQMRGFLRNSTKGLYLPETGYVWRMMETSFPVSPFTSAPMSPTQGMAHFSGILSLWMTVCPGVKSSGGSIGWGTCCQTKCPLNAGSVGLLYTRSFPSCTCFCYGGRVLLELGYWNSCLDILNRDRWQSEHDWSYGKSHLVIRPVPFPLSKDTTFPSENSENKAESITREMSKGSKRGFTKPKKS